MVGSDPILHAQVDIGAHAHLHDSVQSTMAFSMTMVGIFFLIDSLFIVTALMTMRWRTASDSLSCAQNSSRGNAALESKRRAKGGLGGGSIIKDCLSFFCNVDGKKKNVVKEFPNFTPLPWYKGKLSVAFSVAVSTILLSRFVLGEIGVDPTATSIELCSTVNSESRMLEMEETLQNITHLDYARNTSNHLAAFYDALVADTALYGVEDVVQNNDFTCPDSRDAGNVLLLSGDKADWAVPTDEPALSHGAFFPGFCAGALEASIQSARERKCVEAVCVCKKIFGICFGGATEHCFDRPIPCKVHAKDVSDDDKAALNSYRKEQLLRAVEEDLSNFTETPGVPVVANAAAAEVAETILFQVDVASLLYVGYALVGLFIPVPLVLYKSPLMSRVKRAAFGADKGTFLIVLAIWWGYGYFREILFSPELAIYFRNLQLDPCYVDPDFLLTRKRRLADVCSELSAMSNEFPLNSFAVDDILTEVSPQSNRPQPITATFCLNACAAMQGQFASAHPSAPPLVQTTNLGARLIFLPGHATAASRTCTCRSSRST